MQATDYVAANPASQHAIRTLREANAVPDQKPRIRYGYWIGAGVAGTLLWAGLLWLVLA